MRPLWHKVSLFLWAAEHFFSVLHSFEVKCVLQAKDRILGWDSLHLALCVYNGVASVSGGPLSTSGNLQCD